MKKENSEWEKLWDERLRALESLYGKSAGVVGHAVVPFEFGPEIGGAADVVYFNEWKPGRLSVTAQLIGCDEQKPNDQGAFELAICHRTRDEQWGPNFISRLAHYTLDAVVNPEETMDIGSAVPADSTIAAFLFHDLGRFTFRGRPAGVLLCIGITADECAACRVGRTSEVLEALQRHAVYPYTDLDRKSVLPLG